VPVSKKKPCTVAVPGSITAGICAPLVATTGISLTTTTASVLPEFMLQPDGTSGPDSIPLPQRKQLLKGVYNGGAKREIAGV